MRVTVLLVSALVLGGCALPVPVQVASWMIDGISLVTTEKSLTDHGLSMVAGQDCALWRALTETSVCLDSSGLMLAEAAPVTLGPAKVAPVEIADVFMEPDLTLY